MNDKKLTVLDQFLQSIPNKHTRWSYQRGLTLFHEFAKKPLEKILAERKEDLTPKPTESIIDAKQRSERFERELLEPFYQHLRNAGYKANSAAKNCDGIMRLMAYYSMPITLRNGSPISEGRRQIGLSRFPLKIEHVRQMFWAEKALIYKVALSLAVDFPARIEDFLNIQVSELPDLNQEPPIEFMRLSTKENQLQKSCLSALTVRLLEEYLSVYKPKTWLFIGQGKDPNKQLSEDSLNRELKRLANVCHIQVKPYSISWHCFRDMILSSGKGVGIDEDVLKLITGKAVSKAMLPYMKTLDIRKPFTELQKVVRIDGELLAEKDDVVVQLKQTVERQQKEIEDLQTHLRFLTIAYGKDIEERATRMMREGQLSQEGLQNTMKFIKSARETFKKGLTTGRTHEKNE